MTGLRDLIRRQVRDGRVTWIGLRPARRAEMIVVEAADIQGDGLRGDHGRAGKRAITLLQAEHIPVIAALCDGPVSASVLRRNVVVSGINLAALRGRQVQLGGAVVTLTGPCAPCSRMEEALGPGGYSAVRHHGGWCASVDTPGPLAIGDSLCAL
ncbi:molybdenum cofactor sulfurase [Jannaschia pagri]|uniref:Molybdenum cofactor sulfurase n=1 Tax=Jannaschia pagri TaxID=2829797 RepID=A0ABQ4NQM2_9RHOB|nr:MULTISPECIES: MOSC domain-containing protein [unclassified Jannaschia]GIT92811.1 molybdenum cofactor sulfurase [Jannaschia sp. AI_61]GIT96646.1 molybdenum cofactor sulfurase [Jannaschia sp. AI_62]